MKFVKLLRVRRCAAHFAEIDTRDADAGVDLFFRIPLMMSRMGQTKPNMGAYQTYGFRLAGCAAGMRYAL
jgi:hypothetical protein